MFGNLLAKYENMENLGLFDLSLEFDDFDDLLEYQKGPFYYDGYGVKKYLEIYPEINDFLESNELFAEIRRIYGEEELVIFIQKSMFIYEVLNKAILEYFPNKSDFKGELEFYHWNEADFILTYYDHKMLITVSLKNTPADTKGFVKDMNKLKYMQEFFKSIGCEDTGILWMPLYVPMDKKIYENHKRYNEMVKRIDESIPELKKCYDTKLSEYINIIKLFFKNAEKKLKSKKKRWGLD